MSLCEAVLPYYNQALSAGEVCFDDLRPISIQSEVRGLISLMSVYIHSRHRAGMALTGLEFECAWDPEHGFGVLLHGGTILRMNGSEAAFTEPEAEQEPLEPVR